jgi:hypothetical protein
VLFTSLWQKESTLLLHFEIFEKQFSLRSTSIMAQQQTVNIETLSLEQLNQLKGQMDEVGVRKMELK